MEFQTKSTSKEIYQYCFKRRERTIQKNAKEIISYLSKEERFTVVVEDESIFIHDGVVRRRMWVPEGKRPIVVTTGSHQKTCVFGALCIDERRQFFRQYNAFDCNTFVDYLKKLQNKFHKVMLFLDKATQHYRSIKVRKHLEENKMNMKVEYLPKGSPDFNAVEECWRQGKDDLLVSKHYPKFHNLRNTIAKYYRTKRFHLDITKHLLRNMR